MTPMRAAELRVVHHDDRETVYEQVCYWPYGGGTCVDILTEDGRIVATHEDVLHTLVTVAA